MDRRTVPVVMVVHLRLKIARACSLAWADSAVCGQETTDWEAEARDRGPFTERDLRIGVGNLFKMGFEAADRGWSAGLYGLGLHM